MGNYEVFATDTYKKVYSALDGSEKQWIDKTKENLKENPTGKILQFQWFREKKFNNKRLFYLIDEENKKILFVGFATKKEQQKIIDFVVENNKELFELLKNLRTY